MSSIKKQAWAEFHQIIGGDTPATFIHNGEYVKVEISETVVNDNIDYYFYIGIKLENAIIDSGDMTINANMPLPKCLLLNQLIMLSHEIF